MFQVLGGYMLFYDAAIEDLKNNPGELTEATIKTYQWNLRKIRYFAPDLECCAIDEKVIRDFKIHLQEKGNKPATVTKALQVFRIFVNRLRKVGLIEMDPFADVKIGRVFTRRGFLTTRELKQLYLSFVDNKCKLTEKEQECIRIFLFSCFTGLRYSDLCSLKASEIYDWKIRKQTHKTGEVVYIPIPVQARLLLPSKLSECEPVFHVVENCTFNRRLRKAAKKLGFPKYLHCHLARHTFATTCISLGIPLSATSKLLGHRNLDTTLIYAKYVDTFLDKEMRKFNRL